MGVSVTSEAPLEIPAGRFCFRGQPRIDEGKQATTDDTDATDWGAVAAATWFESLAVAAVAVAIADLKLSFRSGILQT